MRINITSLYVADQQQALDFYTRVLGFEVKHDVPVGDGARWLTLVSPEDPDGTELLLEPMGHPAAAVFCEALYADGLPFTQFEVSDIEAEYRRLLDLGVVFSMEPTEAGPVTVAVLDDTCGHWIQLIQP
ncbi:Catechol 2,3-dioxygenase [Corynebacterium pollutisoli]|uniref:Catechol 2,3-dioxygenase n=1 Tax=Corynebacterium pollutisoli TaxID=1610489 RepID=A0A1X7IB09_9CORY|nr:VOC family protein [Corynebacterium pollutisoli]NLP39578.1 VOC family protein [Corynebacterium pollutisoli]SMG11266.1 Catechol 2,3-dioxygenase [Corynebacterium pollutisoli]